MKRLSAIVVLLCVSYYIASASDLNAQAGPLSTEDSTDSSDFYDPLNSEEAYDPQKDYANFRDFKSYEKLYRMSGPPLLPQPLQQRPWELEPQISDDNEDDDTEAANASTNPNIASADVDDESDDAIISTTNPPQNDQHTTIKFFTENSPNIINDILKNTPRPIDTAIESAVNAELVLNKQPEIESMAKTDAENDTSIRSDGNGIHKTAAIFNDDNVDYVNDGVNENNENGETNYSQTITLPYSMDTTIASLPSFPVFIPTRPPMHLLTTSTSTVTTSPINTNSHATSAIVPTQKKSPKKIEALPRVYKYSADEILRKYLDDTFIRAPLATLINTAPEPLRKAKLLWKSALRPNTPIDIVLVAFNSSGVGVTYSFKNTRTMIAGLESVQESREMLEGGSGFYGILRASELVPYDSAIFISTDKIPQDISLMKNAATTLLKKRIRLYLIWFGEPDIDENETSAGGALGEVALRSGGEIFHITEELLGESDTRLVTHFLQNDIQGAQVLDIPLNNSTATNLHIKIQGKIEQATLTTPNGGDAIDLLNRTSVNNYSLGSLAIYLPIDPNDREYTETTINLNISHAKSKGVFSLAIYPKNIDGHYSVHVSEEFNQNLGSEFDGQKKTSKATNILTEYDSKLKRRRLARSEQLSEANDDEQNDNEIVWPEHEADNEFDTVTSNDTEVLSRSLKSILQAVTRIELGTQSQLLANAGSSVQIYYEITNLRDEPTFHNFQVVDEQRFLRSLNPPAMWLPPGQTQTAVVTCYVPPNIEIGAKDKITFTSQGLSLASQSAILTVTSPQSSALDRHPPLIYWNYGSRCFGRTDAGRCAGSIWSLEVTTIDPETGILRIQSNPKGLVVRDRYTAGTTQEVKATYTASCCTPRVSITSYDLAGNQKTITVDVTEYYLDPVEIVAITLGVILLIILIAAIIAAIVYCCKKRQSTRELPVYRSRAERDRST